MENHIGHNIKAIAEEKKLKPQEIAYRWGKTPQAVYDLFRNANPKADQIIAMSNILQIDTMRILGLETTHTGGDKKQSDLKDQSLIDELKNQLKVKDDQISFLQNLIKNYLENT